MECFFAVPLFTVPLFIVHWNKVFGIKFFFNFLWRSFPKPFSDLKRKELMHGKPILSLFVRFLTVHHTKLFTILYKTPHKIANVFIEETHRKTWVFSVNVIGG